MSAMTFTKEFKVDLLMEKIIQELRAISYDEVRMVRVAPPSGERAPWLQFQIVKDGLVCATWAAAPLVSVGDSMSLKSVDLKLPTLVVGA